MESTIEIHEKWIRDELVPIVVSKQKALNPKKKINLKNSTIKVFEAGGYIITLCFNVIVVLDVDGVEKVVSVFVKITPNMSKEDYNQYDFTVKFRNEEIAYKDILPSLGSPEEFPMYYYSSVEPDRAVIAISDFSADGFQMSKQRVNLSLDHIMASMKAVGKFHGASFALKFTDRKRFDELRSTLNRSVLETRLHPIHEAALQNGIRRALNHFRQSNDADKVPAEFLQRLEHVIYDGDRLFEYFKSRAKPSEPMAVIGHGDFLRNNVAYSYDEAGVATKAILFDFQTFVHTSPMLDVAIFMANSTGHEIRKKHFDEIFRTYFDAVIAEYLDKTGTSADELPEYLSEKTFLKDYALQLPYAFGICSYFVPMLLTTKNVFEGNNLQELPEDIFTFGGPVVDEETHEQILEMYDLYEKFNLTLLENQ